MEIVLLCVVVKVGRDGIHGATFSSVALDEGSPATAVQIGDPNYTEKIQLTLSSKKFVTLAFIMPSRIMVRVDSAQVRW